MTTFLDTEKPVQISFKKSSPTFTESARKDGLYKGKPLPFCLPGEYSE